MVKGISEVAHSLASSVAREGEYCEGCKGCWFGLDWDHDGVQVGLTAIHVRTL